MNPLIFLDVDGVLNTLKWNTQAAKLHPDVQALLSNDDPRLTTDFSIDTWAHMVDPARVDHVQRIAELTGADIVISSSWRLHHELDELREMLGEKGLAADVIGRTPTFSLANTAAYYDNIRGLEIEQWLLQNISLAGLVDQRLIILDDEKDMGRLRSHLIQTNWTGGGLLQKHIAKAQRVMNTVPAGKKIAEQPNPAWRRDAAIKLYGEDYIVALEA